MCYNCSNKHCSQPVRECFLPAFALRSRFAALDNLLRHNKHQQISINQRAKLKHSARVIGQLGVQLKRVSRSRCWACWLVALWKVVRDYEKIKMDPCRQLWICLSFVLAWDPFFIGRLRLIVSLPYRVVSPRRHLCPNWISLGFTCTFGKSRRLGEIEIPQLLATKLSRL